MINPQKIKLFWEARGNKYQKVAFESVANLEEDPKLLQMKIELETQQIVPHLDMRNTTRLLDLGAGCGQWSFRLAPFVKEITAVEYTESLAEIGREEARRRQTKNVHFVVSPAEEFKSTMPYDIVFISGLFVYLTDAQVDALCSKLRNFVTNNGQLFVRDGTSILNMRHQIVNRFSSTLKTEYSAIYRTADEYLDILNRAGFDCIKHDNMFKEGCPLNKYSETRLRWYACKPRVTHSRG